MFLTTIFRTIPKSVNEFIFVLGILGFFLALRDRKRCFLAHVGIYIVLLMTGWRVLIQIDTSRYASGLIFLFVISATFFFKCLIKTKNAVARCFLLILAGVMSFLWLKKSYCITFINSPIITIAELHDRYNAKEEKTTLFLNLKDLPRFKKCVTGSNPVRGYYPASTLSDVQSFSDKCKLAYQAFLYDVLLDAKETTKITSSNTLNSCKLVLSIFSQKSKRKRHCLYYIESNSECSVVSNYETIPPESGMLENGDLEIVDSSVESFEKLKRHIKLYSDFYEYDETIRTPASAYFYNGQALTHLRPYYNCSDIDPISGKYSVVFRNIPSNGSLFFYQKNDCGDYEFSVYVRGSKGSSVSLIADLYVDKKWKYIELIRFYLPDKRLYKLKTSFAVDELKDNDYFLAGVTIGNGDAQIDNVALVKIEMSKSDLFSE